MTSIIRITDEKTIAAVREYQQWMHHSPPKFNVGATVLIDDTETSIENTIGIVLGLLVYEDGNAWEYLVMPIEDGEECESVWFDAESLQPAQMPEPCKETIPLPIDTVANPVEVRYEGTEL